MFQFPSLASLSGYRCVTTGGFPHSEIPGSKSVNDSPRLIAAVHVLHRLLTPRHPPCALGSLTTVMNTPKTKSLNSYYVSNNLILLDAMRLIFSNAKIRFNCQRAKKVELNGLEPSTSGLQSPRSPS